eukprot:GHVT01059198.1.p2 GENE.GHVT01059198.1~~GHVT01059198.1.p2  ORF type:complete len:315 (-),score=10.03 GHVT01059198.1:5923-6867(-)
MEVQPSAPVEVKLPRIVIFASGTKERGGSGFEKLVEAQKEGRLKATITAVVCNWPAGGVFQVRISSTTIRQDSGACGSHSQKKLHTYWNIIQNREQNKTFTAGVYFRIFSPRYANNLARQRVFCPLCGATNVLSTGDIQRAKTLGIPFEYFGKPYTLKEYCKRIDKYKAEWICLSGWLKLIPMADRSLGIEGLDPQKTINIHPGPIPRFGGVGMYGANVHKAVHEALLSGEVSYSGPSMHFVTAQYDEGPIIFFKKVELDAKTDTPETIAAKVAQVEHEYQAYVTNLVVNGMISWDGQNRDSLQVPENYPFITR